MGSGISLLTSLASSKLIFYHPEARSIGMVTLGNSASGTNAYTVVLVANVQNFFQAFSNLLLEDGSMFAS